MKNLARRSLEITAPLAVVIVDMICGFTDPKSPLGSESETVVQAHQQLLALFRERGWPVFFTTVVYRSEREARVFRARLPALEILEPGSRAIEIDPALHRRTEEPLIERNFPSAFYDTDLDRQLSALGINSLIVTGLTTSGCVRATAVDGLQHDYPVFIPRECTGDRNMHAHEANLFDLHAKYAEVLSLQSLLDKCRAL